MPDSRLPDDSERLGVAGAAMGIGFSIVVTLIVFVGGGIALDAATNMSPLFTLIGVVIGLIGAGYELFELAQIGRKDRPPGPLTRGLQHLAAHRGALSSAGPPAQPDQPRSDPEQGEE